MPVKNENWGLTPCPTEWDCSVCKLAAERHKEELRRLRDLYVEGVEIHILMRTFELDSRSDLDRHLRQHNWHKKRQYTQATARANAEAALLARIRDTWQYADSSSADKALQVYAKMITGGEKITVDGEVKVAFEERLRSMRKNLENQGLIPVAGGEPVRASVDQSEEE